MIRGKFIEMGIAGVRELAWWLKLWLLFLGDLGSIPNTYQGLQPFVTPGSGNLILPSDLHWYQAHVVYRHTCRQNTHMHKIINSNNNS